MVSQSWTFSPFAVVVTGILSSVGLAQREPVSMTRDNNSWNVLVIGIVKVVLVDDERSKFAFNCENLSQQPRQGRFPAGRRPRNPNYDGLWPRRRLGGGHFVALPSQFSGVNLWAS